MVPCCKTFIMFLTDGEPTADTNSELDRFIYPSATGTAIHGTTCTGDYTGTPASLARRKISSPSFNEAAIGLSM